MPPNFLHLRLHIDDEDEELLARMGTRPVALRGLAPPEGTPAFANDESAARYYLSQALSRDEHASLRGLTAPSRPEVVPDLQLLEVQPATPRRVAKEPGGQIEELRTQATSVVHFRQTRASVPVFGSRATVELDANRELVSIDATLADIGIISSLATLSPQDALRRVAEAAGVDRVDLADTAAPELTYYNDGETGTWHLAWFFRKLPVAPAGLVRSHTGHGLGQSPRDLEPLVNYVIDAHNGSVLLQYPANPMVTRCEGPDEEGAVQTFIAVHNDSAYEMYDPLRSIRTFDLGGGDITGPFPQTPVTSGKSKPWQGTASVSAHVSAMRVQLFLSDVLGRDSIDDKGMEIMSVVNCTYARNQPPPEWFNAVWWNDRMWYGQARDGKGQLRSFARYLDIIAHELTHGVTERTAGLVYNRQSGALNESFSDIFGIIVKNWWTVGRDSDVANWSWEIGAGLGENGLPLRDLSDPKRTGDPDHMSKYANTNLDNGGVHTNSNIHNKAAYNLLTASNADGSRAVSARDVAVLYYLTLQRLGSQAAFADVRRTLINVAKTYFGDPTERAVMLKHIELAYDSVGIT